jgi:hypothetical protein
MDERVARRCKRALVLLVHAVLLCAWMTGASSQSIAFAQQPAAPPTPVPTVPTPAPPKPATTSTPAAPPTPVPTLPTGPAATPAKPAAGSASATGTAAAGSAPTPAQLAEAKKFFEAGLKLMKEQLYQEALASFLEAYRISPRESIQNNIALSYRNLKDFASAYSAYEELLARFGDKMKPAAKNDAQRALEELVILTGLVTIKVQEPDAKVTVDGKEVGKTPLSKPVRVNIGVHTITVSKPGFETITKEITTRGHDEASVDGPLEKEILTGHVSVTLNAPQPDPTAKVIVDGKEVGPAPWEGDLDPGQHTIEAKGDTTVALPRQLDVTKKGKYDVALDLRAAEGTVAVNTGTPDAEITVDNKLVGRGAWEGALPVGKHELAVVKAGFAAYKTSMIVHLGERLAENVQLQPEKVGAAAKEHDWKGVYSQLQFVGMFPIATPANDIAQGRDLTSDASVKTSTGYGGGIGVHVGYSFGFIGIEGLILASYDHSSSDVTYTADNSLDTTLQHPGGPRTESYDFHHFGGSLGAAVRLMPKTQVARPTFAIGGGLSVKAAVYKRDANSTNNQGSNSYPSDVATYVAPMMVMDGGVELGGTPGTRFYLGAMMLLEFAGGAQATASPNISSGPPAPKGPIDLANGTDIYFGPILGMQFGE